MVHKVAGPEIERLISLLAKLPGLGPRSARRAALHLIKKRESLLEPLAASMSETAQKIEICSNCGNVDVLEPCAICRDERRDHTMIVVVEEVGDLWALERAKVTKARYHVLGGVLSPLDGITPQDLNLNQLIERARTNSVSEVLLALNATIEGQSTSHYIMEQLAPCNVKISQLAHGVPVGGELDYLDEGTLAAAVKARKEM